MDEMRARKLLDLTGSLLMVVGRMKRHAHADNPDAVNPGTEFAILETIMKYGQKTVPSIAAFRGVSRQSVQKVVNKMLETKLLVYTENPNHKSSRHLHVTDKGVTQYQGVEVQMVERYMARQVDLSEGDLEAAERVLQTIAEAWVSQSSHAVYKVAKIKIMRK
jgi:DNA-binding MarR family transcriptional regulator